jgi:hypothetical protein
LNAKNSYGGYTGVAKKIVVYTGSAVDHIKDWDFDDHCEALTSFPEFNGGYTPPVPAVPKPNNRSAFNEGKSSRIFALNKRATPLLHEQLAKVTRPAPLTVPTCSG